MYTGQVSVSTGPFLSALNTLVFSTFIKTKQNKTSPDPTFQLSPQASAPTPSIPSLPNLLKEYSKFAAATSSLASAHCHLAGIPLHHSVPQSASHPNGQIQWLFSAAVHPCICNGPSNSGVRVTHTFILENQVPWL